MGACEAKPDAAAPQNDYADYQSTESKLDADAKRVAATIQQAPPPPVVESAAAPLPAGWKAVQTPEGKTYWYHKATKETTWRNPSKPRKTKKKKKKAAPVADPEVAQMKEIFDGHDLDGSGFLSREEIKAMCVEFEMPTDEESLDEMMDLANANGELDFDAFYTSINNSDEDEEYKEKFNKLFKGISGLFKQYGISAGGDHYFFSAECWANWKEETQSMDRTAALAEYNQGWPGKEQITVSEFIEVALSSAQNEPQKGGSGPTAASGNLIVGGTETAVVYCGTDGKLGGRGNLSSAGQIFAVIDPRCNPGTGWLKELRAAAPGKPIHAFMLCLSSTSSPAAMLCAELALQNYGVHNCFQEAYGAEAEKYFVRVDDYCTHGDDLLRQMVEGGFKVYPAEEVGAMKLWVDESAAFGYEEPCTWDETGEEPPERTETGIPFYTSIWNFRAWTHLPFSVGVDEGCIGQAMEDIVASLDGPAMPSIGPVTKTSGGPAGQAICPRSAKPKYIVFNQANIAKFGFPEAVVYDTTSPDLGECNAVFLIDAADDIKFTKEEEPQGGSIPAFAVSKQAELHPENPSTAVLFDASFEAHCQNKWLPFAVHAFIESCGIAIFASNAEAGDVRKFITGAAAGEEDVLAAVSRQSIPFPRLHFFTMGSAMGQQLEANEIIVPAVIVGDHSTGIPADRYMPKDRWSRFFLPGPAEREYAHTLERLIPGSPSSSVSLIAPSKVIARIIEKSCEHMATGSSLATEAESNANDIVSEYQQYSDAPVRNPLSSAAAGCEEGIGMDSMGSEEDD